MNPQEDIRVQLHKAAFGPLHDRSTVLLCAAIDEIERLRGALQEAQDALGEGEWTAASKAIYRAMNIQERK